MMRMGQFGEVAILAVDICKNESVFPEAAWSMACNEIIASESSRKKGCPRAAFLGLSHAGLINGIGVSGESNCMITKNRQYALTAIGILRDNPDLARDEKELWKRVMSNLGENDNKKPNHQMEIVISLWDHGFINT